MNFISALPSKGNLLIVSNGCGSGHIQTTTCVKTDVEKNLPLLDVTVKDVYKHCFGNTIGTMVIDSWNEKQKAENVEALNNSLSYQWADRWILYPIAFMRFFFLFLINDINAVVTTQPVALQAIIRAARVVNFIRNFFGYKGEPIKIQMTLTELPTEDTKNFFYFIKYLSEKDRQIFQLIASPPLLKDGETEQEFWMTNCGLSLEDGEVLYDEYPIRKTLKPLEEYDLTRIKAHTSSDEERALIASCCEDAIQEGDKLVFNVDPGAKVYSILLGSNACVAASKGYIREIINHAKNVKVTPLPYQSFEEVAPLLMRSDVAITKAGGITAMELVALAKKQIFIHASVDSAASEEDLIKKGMPLWEGGNAKYLQKMKGAHVVTPETFGKALKSSKITPIKPLHHLFVFCGKDQGENSLFRQVVDMAKEQNLSHLASTGSC